MHKYYTYIPCLPLINGTWSDSFPSLLLFSRCLNFRRRGRVRSRGNADNGYYFWSWTPLHAQLCTKAWSIRMEVWMDNKLLFMWFFFLVLNLLRRPTSFRKCYIVFYIQTHTHRCARTKSGECQPTLLWRKSFDCLGQKEVGNGHKTSEPWRYHIRNRALWSRSRLIFGWEVRRRRRRRRRWV